MQPKQSLDQKVDEILRTVTNLAIEFYQFKNKVEPELVKIEKLDKKVDRIDESVTWLVGERKNLLEEKIVSNHQISENIDAVEKLEKRTDRIENHLQLPKMKFSF